MFYFHIVLYSVIDTKKLPLYRLSENVWQTGDRLQSSEGG